MAMEWHGEEVRVKVQQAAARGVMRGTESVREEALRLILQTPKSGRLYRLRGGIEHQASAPFEPPASRYGGLVSSVRTEYKEAGLVGKVIAGTFYAAHLEYGTQNMLPRPFMRPALSSKLKQIEQDIATEVRNVLNERGPGSTAS